MTDTYTEGQGLTPWEKWLLQKAREDRKKVKEEIRKKKMEMLENQKKKEVFVYFVDVKLFFVVVF